MWNRPQLLNALADLLFAASAAALLVAAAVWVARLPHFRLSEAVVVHELREVRRAEVEHALAGLIKGNFFSVNVDAVRQSLERIAWVRHAEVRRQWPSGLRIRIEEHAPVANWGEGSGQLLNSYGEVFAAALVSSRSLPVLHGPAGVAPEVLAHYREAVSQLERIGRVPRVLTMSPRLAVQLRLDDGMIVELGRQDARTTLQQRLRRFVEHYPSVLGAGRQRPAVVDLRYPNGFALRLATAPSTERVESKGKQ